MFLRKCRLLVSAERDSRKYWQSGHLISNQSLCSISGVIIAKIAVLYVLIPSQSLCSTLSEKKGSK